MAANAERKEKTKQNLIGIWDEALIIELNTK